MKNQMCQRGILSVTLDLMKQKKWKDTKDKEASSCQYVDEGN